MTKDSWRAIFCPMTKRGGGYACWGPKCAWWDKEWLQCALLTIAEQLTFESKTWMQLKEKYKIET